MLVSNYMSSTICQVLNGTNESYLESGKFKAFEKCNNAGGLFRAKALSSSPFSSFAYGASDRYLKWLELVLQYGVKGVATFFFIN